MLFCVCFHIKPYRATEQSQPIELSINVCDEYFFSSFFFFKWQMSLLFWITLTTQSPKSHFNPVLAQSVRVQCHVIEFNRFFFSFFSSLHNWTISSSGWMIRKMSPHSSPHTIQTFGLSNQDRHHQKNKYHFDHFPSRFAKMNEDKKKNIFKFYFIIISPSLYAWCIFFFVLFYLVLGKR